MIIIKAASVTCMIMYDYVMIMMPMNIEFNY
jgi:hypothetical protein